MRRRSSIRREEIPEPHRMVPIYEKDHVGKSGGKVEDPKGTHGTKHNRCNIMLLMVAFLVGMLIIYERGFLCPTRRRLPSSDTLTPPSSPRGKQPLYSRYADAKSKSEFANGGKASPAFQIADWLKDEILTSTTPEKLREMVKDYYKRLKLRTNTANTEKWHPDIERYGNLLLPELDFAKLVEDMAYNAHKNPAIQEFLETLASKLKDSESISMWIGHIKGEASQQLPQFIAWAMALENITKTMYDDPDFALVCEDIWEHARTVSACSGCSPAKTFFGIKYASVRQPFVTMVKAVSKTNDATIEDDFGTLMLPLNIREAVMGGCCMRQKNNADAGEILASYANSHAGDKTYSDDKAVVFGIDMQHDWADLYQSWNLAFCTTLPNNIQWCMKLLIPSVSGYHDEPKHYIHKRVLALYTTLTLELFADQDTTLDRPNYNWRNAEVSRIFGSINEDKALEFEKKHDEHHPEKKCCRRCGIFTCCSLFCNADRWLAQWSD